MTTIYNLYGGPGTGKSTSAAYLYYRLKAAGKNAELVREYVKDWAWEGRKISTYDQLYFTGKQIRRESLLYGKTEVIVTDSPVMMGILYSQKFSPCSVAEGVKASTLAFYRQAAEDGHQHRHVFLKRTKPYNPSGRYQTEDQARELDAELKGMLQQLNIPFEECGTEEESLDKLFYEK